MSPDLNSLPPSRSMSTSPTQPRAFAPPQDTPSPRSSSISLAAAATMNAADLSRNSSISNRGSPRLGRANERRRSNVAMSLNLNDPTIPGPGELSSSDHRTNIGYSYTTASPSSLGGMRTLSNGDPHHQRNPSLGEIHQELEQEQEAQVNRMLQLIRQQQQQLEEIRNQPGHHSRHHSGSGAGAAIIDDVTPVSEQSSALPQTISRPARRYSRGAPSASPSPLLRPRPNQEMHTGSSFADWPPSPIDIVRRNSLRDESTYFQAETASLTRENQMLRLRIRELERQINDMNATQANTPSIASNLVTSPPIEGVPMQISTEENKM
jgi:hypothetical protein